MQNNISIYKYFTILLTFLLTSCMTNLNIKEDKLIDREILFSNPDKASVRLSPNGEYISYLAPHNDILNIWVAPIDNIENAKLISNSTSRPIRNYGWSKNNEHIIYMQDNDGDENWQLYSINIHDKNELQLTHPYLEKSNLENKKAPLY